MERNPVLGRLGLGERAVIIHLDDIGMCQTSVTAFTDLAKAGVVSSGAVMTPCPWFAEAAEAIRSTPNADVGVHLTLNCEWPRYRWGALTTRDPRSGLLAADGGLHRSAAETQEHADPEAAAREMAAQVERALGAGIDATHVDTHMGTVSHPKFMHAYLELARSHRLPLLMPRLDEAGWRAIVAANRGAALDDAAIATAVELGRTLERAGFPLLDAVIGMPLDGDPDRRLEEATRRLAALPPGLTHFIIHAAADTPELRAIAPDWRCRVADHETFQHEELLRLLEKEGIAVIGYRALRDTMRTGGEHE